MTKFSFTLNGHFEGEAGGELFNGAGKTDILIRHHDRNVFIAECKFWEGQKGLKEAIDQLSSYLVWRDTKAALVVFIKRGNPTACLVRAQEAIRTHETFKRDGPSPDPEAYTTYISHTSDRSPRTYHDGNNTPRRRETTLIWPLWMLSHRWRPTATAST